MTARKKYAYGDTCKYGHIITPENSKRDEMGVLRCLRCETHCTRGHEKTAENWIKSGKQYRCVPCRKQMQKKYYSTERGRQVNRDKERRRRALVAKERTARLLLSQQEGDVAHKNDEKRTAPHNALGIKQEAIESWTQMGEILETLRTPCYQNRDKFTEYADPRYPDDPLEQEGRAPFPSTGEAEEWCTGCPLLQSGVCLSYALTQKEDFGVWGGKRIVNGRVYRGPRKVVKDA